MASKTTKFPVRILAELMPLCAQHGAGIRLKADEIIKQGCMAALDPANNGQLISADAAMPAGARVIGVNAGEEDVDNRNGLIGAKTMVPRMGIFEFDATGTWYDKHLLQPCAIEDDHTVKPAAGTDADRFAGIFLGNPSTGKALVLIHAGALIAPATLSAVTTANGSDAGTTQALANSLKTAVNAIIAALAARGITAPAA